VVEVYLPRRIVKWTVTPLDGTNPDLARIAANNKPKSLHITGRSEPEHVGLTKRGSEPGLTASDKPLRPNLPLGIKFCIDEIAKCEIIGIIKSAGQKKKVLSVSRLPPNLKISAARQTCRANPQADIVLLVGEEGSSAVRSLWPLFRILCGTLFSLTLSLADSVSPS